MQCLANKMAPCTLCSKKKDKLHLELDVLEVKNTFCSFRKCEFSLQHPFAESHNIQEHQLEAIHCPF